MLFVRYGTPEDCLMDILFKAIEKEVRTHVPEYYEIQYEAWDGEVFYHEFNKRSVRVLEGLEEELESMIEEGGEEKMKKYFQIINIINDKIGFNTFKQIPGGYEIRILNVDKDSLMVNYGIRKRSSWNPLKKGSAPLKYILNMLNTEPLIPYVD
jgi:predicted house-cleaning noncanonical NTP pyrophosphatase (MazG superfamily)